MCKVSIPFKNTPSCLGSFTIRVVKVQPPERCFMASDHPCSVLSFDHLNISSLGSNQKYCSYCMCDQWLYIICSYVVHKAVKNIVWFDPCISELSDTEKKELPAALFTLQGMSSHLVADDLFLLVELGYACSFLQFSEAVGRCACPTRTMAAHEAPC
jgi:hypothetical protein